MSQRPAVKSVRFGIAVAATIFPMLHTNPNAFRYQIRAIPLLAIMITTLNCAPSDPTDRVIQRISSNPYFRNGAVKMIELQKSAPIDEVIKQAVKNDIHFALSIPEPIKVISKRDVKIQGKLYTAVLVDTQSGRRVVLISWLEASHSWWNRVYDIK